MGLKRFIRKIVPREIRDNPLVAVVAVIALGPVALGAIGASTASIVGATVAANTATAVALGTAVVTTGVTFAQTQDVSDSLKAGVRAGVGSAVGSAVSSSVTNAVAGQTGASLADLEPALRELPSQAGIGGSLAGAASITAGNVAGEAARAAITGRPIEEGALLGLAGSIPQSLSMAPEFNSLHPIVQNVVASSAQAAVRGQDVGDAALTALITSSKIVSRAINELPGGQDLIRENPRFTKYIIDSVSSALAAQLQGKDVSESVIQRLVMTTAEIIGQEIESAQESGKLQQAQSTYTEAQQKEQQLQDATAKLNSLMQTPENANLIGRYNYLNEYLQSVAVENQQAIGIAEAYIDSYNRGFINGETAKFQIDNAVARAKLAQDSYNTVLLDVYDLETKLTRNGFRAQYNELTNQIQALNGELTALTNTLQAQASDLAQSSASFFEDLSTEFATTIAPLTAFEDVTDVGDQDVLAEIQPVAPPSPEIGVEVAGPVSPDILGRLQSMPLFGETVYRETETPRPDSISGTMNMRFVEGFRTDGTPYYYAIATFEDGDVRYVAYQDGEPTIFDNRPDLKTSGAGVGDVAVDAEVSGEGQGAAGVGTGTPGAPAVDLGQAAPVEVVDPAFTVGFDLRDFGPGSPLSPNLALFEIGGGRGTPGGSSTETTFNLVSRDQGTGQETYDVGGKQYALVVLPDKQVLVPQEPSEVIVYLERDPVTNLPKMKEVPVSTVPPQEAQQIAEKVGQTAGGAPAGAEGAAGGRTAEEDRVATTEEQLQPGARPEEVAAAPSFPELISGETEPTMPAPVPGEDAGFEEAIRAPGAGGVEGEITDEDIIRLIQGELGTPGGGEGEGAPGEEGAGVGEGEEGVGPGAGEEGEGEGVAGEGEGTGEGVGPGTGEGGGEVTPSPDILLPTARVTTVGRRTFQRPGEAAPYRVTGMDESGILGRKQPLFGGDEDLQRAEWNRRSLRLKRLLGL
jgi:hypothetical protein